jgi:BTG family
MKHDKNVPNWKLKTFHEELFNGLKRRCEGHWYPEDPDRGQGYRSLICAERVDTLLLDALKKAQLTLDMRQICGEEAVMYVDPGNVSIRLFPPYARGRRDITQTLFPINTNGSTSPPPPNINIHSNNIHRPIVQLA